MDYKYTLIVENENEEKIFEMSCLTLEGVEEELLRKAKHAIEKWEAKKEAEYAQGNISEWAELHGATQNKDGSWSV